MVWFRRFQWGGVVALCAWGCGPSVQVPPAATDGSATEGDSCPLDPGECFENSECVSQCEDEYPNCDGILSATCTTYDDFCTVKSCSCWCDAGGQPDPEPDPHDSEDSHDDWDSDDSDWTESSYTSDSGGPSCEPDLDCVAAAPDGWIGPAIVARVTAGRAAPECPEGYIEGAQLFANLVDPGPAICDCACAATDEDCDYYGYGHYDGSCNTLIYVPVSASCAAADLPGYANVFGYETGEAACSAESTSDIAPASWESSIVACRIDDAAPSCEDGGVCRPAAPPEFETSCIYTRGDVACPSDVFATKHLYHGGFDDSRACGECSCEPATPGCTADMLVFAEDDCSGVPVAAVPSDGACTPAMGAAVALADDGDPGCAIASPSQPQGGVVATGAFTFCCDS